jgi:hypothetical protein
MPLDARIIEKPGSIYASLHASACQTSKTGYRNRPQTIFVSHLNASCSSKAARLAEYELLFLDKTVIW